MKHSLLDRLLSQLSEFIAAGTALHFPRDRWSDLEHRTSSAAKEFGFADQEAFIQWLVSSAVTREQIEILASHLTIAETYFWREPQTFKALHEHILPDLIRSRQGGERRLRIWSAGCASGEEPYSIAIALRRTIPAGENWHVTILATDINPCILRRATAGVYGEWSFRNTPPWLKREYFRPNEDGRFEILPEIRKMVTFAYLNLAQDVYPSTLNNTNAMDLIFCRNVFMYFKPEAAGRIGQGLHRSLVDGGWLVVGASELSHQTFARFTPVQYPGAIVYRKAGQISRHPVVYCFVDPSCREAPAIVWGRELGVGALPVSSRIEQSQTPPPFSIGEEMPEIMKPSLQENAYAAAIESCAQEDEKEASPSVVSEVRALANQGRLEEALAICEEGLTADKLDSQLHYLRAIIFLEQNREAEATASFKAALYLAPSFVPAHFALGNLLLRRGNRRAAKRCFDNVLALLRACGREELLPESEGLTAGRFREIVQATIRIVD